MNTAQVSIELVLAGILALCAFVLPFLERQTVNTDLLQSEALIGILGLSYLLGVVFDKLADTLLAPREQYLRLKQAGNVLNRIKNFRRVDPFPQDELEYLLKKEKDGRLDWMNSLKSRMRTSRELAVLGLPATLGIIVHFSASAFKPLLYAAVVLNLFFLILPAWRPPRGSVRTDGIARDNGDRKAQLELIRAQRHPRSVPYYLLLAVSTIGILVAVMINPGNTIIPFFGAAGLIVTMLGWWTCERITSTYFEFIAREMFHQMKEKTEVSRR